MREQTGKHVVALQVLPGTQSKARFVLLICAECGQATWYAHGLDSDDLPDAEERACLDCRNKSWWLLAEVREQGKNGEVEPFSVMREGFRWKGRFQMYICRQCGWSRWYAKLLPGRAQSKLRPTGEACRSCKGRLFFRVQQVRERGSGANVFHVAWQKTAAGLQGVGYFSVEVCAKCGFSEWFARDLHELKSDPERGVLVVKRRKSEGREAKRS
jgi:predicted nucleic-acid-binding Zn-ribbon protein